MLPAQRAEGSLLENLQTACRALAEAKAIPEAKTIRDMAEAIRTYLCQQGYCREAQQHAAELKLRAERRLGELLRETVRRGGNGSNQHRRQQRSHDATFARLPEGVTKTDSSRWQQVASLPAEVFEGHVRAAREKGQELTTSGVLKLAKALQQEATRRHLREGAVAFARTHFPEQDLDVIAGDMKLLFDRLEDCSVSLFLTDPVWWEPEQYRRLAELAAAKLKPGGLCLAYTGSLYLETALLAMREHLTYWCRFTVLFGGARTLLPGRNVQQQTLTIVAYGKPPLRMAPVTLSDLIEGSGTEKDLQEWQQGQAEAEYLIERLTHPGDLVVDPFCGSGTVPAAACVTGRRWLATEIQPKRAEVARGRLAKLVISGQGAESAAS